MTTHRGHRISRQSVVGVRAEPLEARRMLDATITARVFHDYNGNGVFDAGGQEPEALVQNYRVYIDVNDNGQYDSGTDTQFFTEPDGTVTIGGLDPLTEYKIGVAPRDVEGVTTDEVKAVTTGLDGSTTSAGDYGIGRSRITGRVWIDANDSGTYDVGEGAGAVRVYLDNNKNGIFDAGDEQTWTAPTFLGDGVTPNPNAGNYRFNFIDAGNYDVRVFPAHYQEAITDNPIVKNLAIKEVSTGNDFGLTTKAAIGGLVFNDTNGDGVRQGAETVRANVRVYIDVNSNSQFDGGEPSALSDANGVYHIDAVEPGTHTVRVVLPVGVTSSTPTSREVSVVKGQETVFTNFGLVSGAVVPVVPNDFNGDGKRDIIVTQNGVSTVWYMNGTTRTGTAALPNFGAGFTLAAYGDFDGDDKPDLLVHNAATGVPKIITLNGVAQKGQVVLPASNTQWKPVGAGDFDGDGDLDIVWRNQTTGQNTTWRMNGTALASFKALPSTADNNWFIAGVGDFDGDGDEDLVWRHSGNGRNTAWLLDNNPVPAFKALPSTANQAWQPVAITSFNNDNLPDILWINSTTGANQIWFMTAGQPAFGTVTL